MLPPKYRTGNLIKGDPKNPVKTAIDFSKYKQQLSQPIEGTGTNFVGNDQNAFTPDVLKANGYKYVSGTMKGKDIVYEKNGNYHLYNEQPNSTYNKYGLINIGNPYAASKGAPGAPLAEQAQRAVPVTDPNHQPLNLSNPNMTFDPNTGNYYNPSNGSQVKPIVETYKKGGKIPKAPVFRKGYALGDEVVPQNTLTTNSLGPTITPSENNNYATAFANANEQNTAQQQKKDYSSQIAAGKNIAGKALGTYGTTYFATNPGNTQGENLRAAGLAAAGQSGPIGGVVSGVAAIGDQIGKPIREKSEKTDENGNLVDVNKAKRNAFFGAMFSPSQRLSYKGGLTDVTGQRYLNSIEVAAKDKINADRVAEITAQRQAQGLNNQVNQQEALAARDSGEENLNPVVPNVKKQYSDLNVQRPTKVGAFKKAWRSGEQSIGDAFNNLGSHFKFSDGGKIKGAGTGTSDSIKAEIKPGSFVVPAKNAPVAEEIREKVLLKAPKVANLKQGGGTPVKLSNGEHVFSPEEKQEIEMYGIDLDALAPDAEHNEKAMKSGGLSPEKARIILHDGTIRGKIISDRQRKYFGYISNGHQCGGMVKAYTSGGSIHINPEHKGMFSEWAKENGFGVQEAATHIMANKEDYSPSKIKQANFARNAATWDHKATGGDVDGYAKGGKTPPKKIAPKLYKSDIFSRDWAAANPGDVTAPEPVVQAKKNKYDTAAPVNGEDPNLAAYNRDVAAASINPTEKKRKGFDPSTLIDYGIPAIQAGLGLNYLKKAGPRPVDQLSPDYLHSIDTARGNVVTANANAKFGFSPEEQAAIDQQNTGLTNVGRYDARNFSGGSSANALNMERSVINDSFARGLAAKTQNRNLIFQKQQIANDRQQYLDSLVTNKVNMSNRLFNMKLDAWQQQQSTGVGLLQAAAQNAIGAKQWQDEKQMAQDRANLYNPQPTT